MSRSCSASPLELRLADNFFPMQDSGSTSLVWAARLDEFATLARHSILFFICKESRTLRAKLAKNIQVLTPDLMDACCVGVVTSQTTTAAPLLHSVIFHA